MLKSAAMEMQQYTAQLDITANNYSVFAIEHTKWDLFCIVELHMLQWTI